jgi:hypothetical protein
MSWRAVADAPTTAALALRRSHLEAARRELDVEREALLRSVCRDGPTMRETTVYSVPVTRPATS